MDRDLKTGNRPPQPASPERPGAPGRGSQNSWVPQLITQGPASDGLLAWILYMVGCAFLAAGDKNSVLEILPILEPLQKDLAALLSAKLGQSQDKSPG